MGFVGKEGQMYPVQTSPVVDCAEPVVVLAVVDAEPVVNFDPVVDTEPDDPVVGLEADVPHSGHSFCVPAVVSEAPVDMANVVATPVVGGITTFPQGPTPTYGGLQAVINGIEIIESCPGSESVLIYDGTVEGRACQN